jgi:hypothetical protein
MCKKCSFNIVAFVGFIVWIVYQCTDKNNITTLRFLFTFGADLLSMMTFVRLYNWKCFLRIVATDVQSITISFLFIHIGRKYFRWESRVVLERQRFAVTDGRMDG